MNDLYIYKRCDMYGKQNYGIMLLNAVNTNLFYAATGLLYH